MSKYMKSAIVLLLFGWSFLLMPGRAPAETVAKAGGTSGPLAALKSLTDDGRLQISATDRCPVCGMFPAKQPKSAAALVLADGRTFYFCGNGCLLRTWRATPVYLKAPREAIQRMVVQDYFTGQPVDAIKAWWVAGSDVIGPMGPAIVALGSEQAAARFQARHGGKEIFQLAGMDDALWGRLFPSGKK